MEASGTLHVSEIATLYELSLSIGRSLDLKESCEHFLSVLVSRRSLDFASVWLDKEPLEQADFDIGRTAGNFRLIAASPSYQFEIDEERDPEDVGFLQQSEEKGFLIRPLEPSPRVPERITERAVLALFPLGELGWLRLVSLSPAKLEERECRKLLRLIERFTLAISACLSHGRAISEIEERRKAQAEVAEASELLTTLSDSLVSALLVEGEGLEVMNANATFYQMFGFEQASGIHSKSGDEVFELLAENVVHRERVAEWRNRMLNGDQSETLHGLKLKDRRILEIDHSCFGSRSGHRGHLWQFRDVTETSAARKLVEESDLRQRLLLDNALDAVISIDQQGRIIGWNPQAEQVFGFELKEVMGRRMSELIVPERHRAAHDQGLVKYLKTGEGPVLNQRIEIEAIRKGGEEIPIELTIHPVVTREETTFTAFARDITERKVIERMKDELVSTVSHELRTPLTSLKGFVEMLLTRDYDKERQRQFLQIVYDESERLGRLINDFLDIQRLESGKFEFDLEPLDLAAVVQEMISVFNANPAEQTIELQIEEDLPWIAGDSDRLRQVVANLLSNATKFSDGPGVIRVSVAADDTFEEVVLSVQDEGIGIPEDELEKLFEKFFRSEQARVRAIGGSGLGLALVQQIVESHRGSVTVESKIGEGSRFVVRLPVLEENEDGTAS